MEHRIERRMRVKKNDSVKEEQAKINSQTAAQLKIADSLEVVVAGKRKLVLKALTGADVPANEVWACPDDMVKAGVADNSIATIRGYSGS